MDASSTIAIVCGLKSEASAVKQALGEDFNYVIGVSGAHAGRAEAIAEGFCQDGAGAIVSVGVSGGLDPTLRPGDLVIAENVVTKAGENYPSDLELLKSLLTSPEGDQAHAGAVFGADDVISSAVEKARIFEEFGCLAVDMESHGAARAAARTKIPFVAIRSVADPHDQALPAAALGAVAEDGSTQVIKTLGAALRQPGQFPALMQLGRSSAAATKTLRRALRPLAAQIILEKRV